MSMAACAVLKRLGERGRIRPVSLEAPAIHEERRRSSDAAAHAGRDIALNPLTPRPGRKIVGHGNRIDPARRRVLDQLVVLQRILVLKEHVVHPPERIFAATCRHGFGGFGCWPRMRVRFAYRKVPEHESHVLANIFKHLLQDDVGNSTVRAFVVAILNKRDRGIGRTSDVIAWTSGSDEH